MSNRVLIHVCCAPCLVYPLKVLREEGYEVTGFFYNPNIHPFSEYRRRLETLINYSRFVMLPLRVDDSYDLKFFLKGQIENMERRCIFCYRIRLERAYEAAKNEGFPRITTTLLYSKHQKHEAIREICEELSSKHGIEFLYFDFRKGWKEGIEESKALNLYRQSYCGCIFSEAERFRN